MRGPAPNIFIYGPPRFHCQALRHPQGTPRPTQRKEYENYLCWSAGGTEILIKSPCKLEEKVLPQYFRHRKLSSFIRQMNMYGFTKVNKLSKDKAHIYFKNENFLLNDP